MSDQGGGVAMHRLERSIRALSTRPVRDLERKHARAAEDGLAEYDQQFQIPIRGTAASTLAWTEQRVDFETLFYDASEQRDSSYPVPQFTYGSVIESGAPAMIAACVVEWKRNRRQAIHAAIVAIGVLGDGDFDGYLHATFQGYGQSEFGDLGV